MKKLPPAAAGMLERARKADRAQGVDFEHVLTKLHATLPFADAGIGAPAGESGAPQLPPAAAPSAGPALGTGGLLATKAAKLVLVTVALSGGLGGALMLRSGAERTPPAASAARTSVEQTPHEPSATPASAASEPRAEAPSLEGSSDVARDHRAVEPLPTSAHTGGPFEAQRPKAAAAKQAASVQPEAATQAASAAVEARSRVSAKQTEAQPQHTNDLTRPSESELDLIDGAFAELRKGDPAQALALLERHRSRYPSGMFTTERKGLNVLALCALGRVDEGRIEQAKFLRNASNSPIAARVRNACPTATERP